VAGFVAYVCCVVLCCVVLSLRVVCTCLDEKGPRLYIRHLPRFIFTEFQFSAFPFPEYFTNMWTSDTFYSCVEYHQFSFQYW